jgi:riboflavin biosynthesis pyrimidine reductase
MKPHVICHMASSADGRTLPGRWRPEGGLPNGLYERLHDDLAGDAWLVGRITGAEFAKGAAYPEATDKSFPREAWITRRGAKNYAVVLDAHGKIAWGRSDIAGDPIVVVLCAKVVDAHLAGLRADEVSYIFAGEAEIDLEMALELLNRELAVKRLLLEGGGITNGAFLRAGLVDELSLILCSAVDGTKVASTVFDSARVEEEPPIPLRRMTLKNSEMQEGGAVWLRYNLQHR